MADRTGQQLGNYRVIRPIGRGGFAEVYLGEHIYLKTQVAIKLLRTTVANPEDLDAFLIFCHRTSTFIENASAYSPFRRFPVPSFPMFLPCVHGDVDRGRSAGWQH